MTTHDDSGTHATLADSGDTSTSQTLPRGSNLGRYVIIEPIGSGGMGTVYRAYDPQLNRGVALKILSVKQEDFQAAERAKARLIREAQALAQLSHPNVVAVHDAGTFEDDVFIAMELVEGKTLDEWMRQEKRSVKEILEVMIAAGRGLSAAHKAGLVHRDFKPGNVIVGDDGRVRVLDFGLARAVDQAEVAEEEPSVSETGSEVQDEQSQESKKPVDWKEISSDSSVNLLQSPLTHAGGILGTPMYMAPEQHLGQKTDERTDQFGFCVVLYEALYRKRPFLARTREELRSEVIRQQVCVPSEDSDVPKWLWQIVRKGLSANPEGRFPKIDSLLEELDTDPEELRRQKRVAHRRKLLLISLILLIIALPIGVWYGLRYRTFQLCKAVEGEFDGIWDSASKESVQKAFLSTKKLFAQGTWERVERIFDRHLSHWTRMRSDVCEARLIRGTQSEELFDLRMSCLNERRQELKALTKIFTMADSMVLQKAVQASSSLTGINICADEKAMRAPYPPPKTTDDRMKVAIIREKLAEVEAFFETGKYREGMELSRRLEENANSVDYRPIQAKALYWYGRFLERAGKYRKAEKTLHNSIRAAGISKDALLAAKALALLVWVIGYQQARLDEGMYLAREAEVMLDFAGGNDKVRASLFNWLGVIAWSSADLDKALEYFHRTLALATNAYGSEHTFVANVLNNIGGVFTLQGEYAKALKHSSEAVSIKKKLLGLEHPEVALSLNNLGAVFQQQGNYIRALQNYREVLEIHEKGMGSERPYVAATLYNMGVVFSLQGNYGKANEYLRRSLEIRENSYGPEHFLVAESLVGIGIVLVDQGRNHKARELLDRAVSICEKKTCEADTHGSGLFGLARVFVNTNGDKARATKLVRQAREIFSKTPKAFKNKLKEVNTWLQKHGEKKLAKKAHK